MADYRDVMRTRAEADSARIDIDMLAGKVEDGSRNGDYGLAVLLSASAVALELRALGTILEHVMESRA